MKPKLNMDKIAEGLGAERRGNVQAGGGYFGALNLAADVHARFKTPDTGGRATDPGWTVRRQIPLTPETLSRLEELAAEVAAKTGVIVSALQVAALLLEQVTAELTASEQLVRTLKRA